MQAKDTMFIGAAVALLITLATCQSAAHATNTPGADCVGHQACQTNSNNVTNNDYRQDHRQAQQQGQHQGQQQSSQSSTNSATTSKASSGGNSLTTGGYVYNNKSLSITPVQAISPAVVAPTALVSTIADPYCGPRQKVMSKDINGRIIGLLWDSEVALGENQWLAPDFDTPYRKVEVVPGQLYQLIGHKTHETTTVLTVSTSGALAFGANGGSGAGGSIGTSRGGALQRMVTTIRVQECVAMTLTPAPKEVAPAAPKKRPMAPSRKPPGHSQKKDDCGCQKGSPHSLIFSWPY